MSFLSSVFKPDPIKLYMKRDVKGLIKALNQNGDRELAHEAGYQLGRVYRDLDAKQQALVLNPILDALVKKLALPPYQGKPYVDEGICYGLQSMGDAALATARRLAQDSSLRCDMRCTGITALSHLGGSEDAAILLDLARHPDPEIRGEAIYALKNWRGQAVEDALVAAMQDSSLVVRYSAIRALCGRDANKLAPVLVAALGDSDARIRKTALDELAKLKNPAFVPAAVRLLADPDSDIAQAAAKLIHSSGLPVPPLEEILACGVSIVQALKDAPGAQVGEAAALDRAVARLNLAYGVEVRDQLKAGIAGWAGARPAKASVYNRGGLGEPYCSAKCFAEAARYAMMDLVGGKCGLCGSAVSSTPASRDYAVVPFEGSTLVVCAKCAPAARQKFKKYYKCCLCQTPLNEG